MLSPVAKAQPAKFTPALTAHHVHATLVLFYGSLALGAGFGVGQNPVGILTLCTVLAQPHADSLTVHLQRSSMVALLLMPKSCCAMSCKAGTQPDKELKIYIYSANQLLSHSVHHRHAQLD